MSSTNNRLSQPICFHRGTMSDRQGRKTFLRGHQQRAAKLRKTGFLKRGK